MKLIYKIINIVFILHALSCAKEKEGTTVDNITLDRRKMTLLKGGTAALTAKVSPEDATDKTIVWSSSDDRIVRVDPNTGVVEAISEGKVTITATAQTNGVKAPCGVVVTSTLNIVFVGNSFTYDAVWWLPGLLHAAGMDNVNMVYMYYSGRLLKEHVSGFATSKDYTCYRANPGTSSWSVDNNRAYSIKDIMDEREWNIVSIQEHTGNTDAWGLNQLRRGMVEQWVNLVSVAQRGGPEFAYIMSQAYGNPDIIPSSLVRETMTNNFFSQESMFTTIAAHGKQILDETRIDRIIPTGTAIQNLRTSSMNTPLDLTRDGWHLDVGLGRYTAACTVFESLMVSYLSGATLDGNGFRHTTNNPNSPQYTTPVTGINSPVAIEAVRHAVRNPFTITSMSNK